MTYAGKCRGERLIDHLKRRTRPAEGVGFLKHDEETAQKQDKKKKKMNQIHSTHHEEQKTEIRCSQYDQPDFSTRARA